MLNLVKIAMYSRTYSEKTNYFKKKVKKPLEEFLI
jgi:hypothetical protein